MKIKKPDFKKVKEIKEKKEKSYFAEYLTASIVIGLLCGAVSGVFNLIQLKIKYVRTELYPSRAFLVLMPVLGVLMLLGMRLLKQEKHGGTAICIKALQDSDIKLKPDFSLGAFFSLTMTNLAESAMVKEAGAFQMTIPAAHFLCDKAYRHVDRSVAAACAVAAGFSGLWGLPVFGAFFAAEIAHGQLRKKALLWGFVSAIFADPIQKFICPASTAYTVPYLPDFKWEIVLKIIILATGIGIFARIMCFSFYEIGKLVRVLKNPYVRIAVGGTVGALVCFLEGSCDFLCGFNDIMDSAFTRELLYDSRLYYAFALKFIVFTILKKSGYKTGKLIQTLSIGVLLGELVGGVALGMTPGLGAMIGMTALFAASYNCQLSAVVLCMEVFPGLTDSRLGIIYFLLTALAIGIARLVSGKCKIYNTQDLSLSAKEEWQR